MDRTDQRKRRRALIALTVAFSARAIVQWLPSYEQWHSGAVPYGMLIIAQVAIVAAQLVMIRRASSRRLRPRLRTALTTFAMGYLVTMAIRLIIGTTGVATGTWFDAPLPSVFHILLATFLLAWLGAPPHASPGCDTDPTPKTTARQHDSKQLQIRRTPPSSLP